MKFYLFVLFIFLLQSATGQVVITSSLQQFSKESLQFADKSLAAVNKPYKVLYIPVLYFALPPENVIDENTTVTQLLNGGGAANADDLPHALIEQQAADLITAKNYFDKLEDNANTILVLDNIVQTAEVVDGKSHMKHLEGRQFIFGDGVGSSIRQVITGYSPSAQLDFNDQTLAANDKYLDEYTSILTTTINRNGAGSIVVEEYPKTIPLLVMIANRVGYVHVDPAANLTNDEREKLKTEILGTIRSIDEVNWTPIDYILKDEDFKTHNIALLYACKLKKGDDYKVGQNTESKRTWKLNDQIMETIGADDKIFWLSAFIPVVDGVASKYSLKDGENIFAISTDVGTTYDKKNQTTTFEIKFSYNSNKLFLKAAINGKNPERVDFGKVIGDVDGKPTLKVGDVIDVYLFKQEGETERVVSTSMWGTDIEKFETADHHTVTIINGTNDIMVKSAKDENVNTIKFSYQPPVVKDIVYSFENVNVDALPEGSRGYARDLFKDALEAIKGKNEALSAYFVANNARIQSYVLPGSDPLLERPKTKDEKETVLLGFANKQLAANYKCDFLDVINIKKKKGVVQEATLVVRLYGNDRQTLVNASNDPTAEGKQVAEPILERLAITDKNMANKVRTLIKSGQLTDGVLNECYELIPDDISVLSKYVGVMTTKKLMYLNYDGILALETKPPVTTENRFASITAHEMVHLYYTSTHYHSVLKWSIIRDKQSKYGYTFGISDCSKADAHEEYNPEDQATCDEQKRYIPEPIGTVPK